MVTIITSNKVCVYASFAFIKFCVNWFYKLFVMKALRRLNELQPLCRNQRKLKMPKIPHTNICVEGNIGCGKTTFLDYFSKRKDIKICYEPVEKWRSVGPAGDNLLDLMYKNPKRWAFTFQSYVQMTMLENHLSPCSESTKLLERSIFSARQCFVENLYQSKVIEEVEYHVYCEWYNMIVKELNITTDLIVYLRTDPAKLHERIMKRQRNEEASIPLEYLKSLHDLHEKWLIDDQENLNVPVLVIDANSPLTDMYKLYNKYSDQICNYKSSPFDSNIMRIGTANFGS